ncbi:MAG: cyclodeaminase/cyclohydrolase family protein [Thermoplasmata archaeon]|nr:MAG: cyclodeaminase/cyclohydrolase family protein [Thermoplasmata archaeon]
MDIESDIEDLLKEISSDSPAPGGGSVAALAGSFGAALISMVCNLTIGKKKYGVVEDEMKRILEEAEALREELFGLSKKDMEAFCEVMEAFKIKDEAIRNEKLQSAYKRAASVPYLVAKKCLRVIELGQFTTAKGNQNAITDSGVGALLAYSGFSGAILNVKVNLKYIEDEDFVSKTKNDMDNLQKKAESIKVTIINEIERFFS